LIVAVVIKSLAEQKALEWATDFFRNCASAMTAEGSKRRTTEFGVSVLIRGYDFDAQKSPQELDSIAARLVNKLRGSDLLPQFVAALLERGDKLPEPLQDFVIGFLRDARKSLTEKPGRKKSTLVVRNINIGVAVGYVSARWKFSATRNREQKVSRPCGASIVRAALAVGAGIHLSEDDIVKAWDRFRRGMRAHDEIDLLIAGDGQVAIGDGQSFVGRIRAD
jgi:hypothetical protein